MRSTEDNRRGGRRGGFTLIELMAVVAVIAIVMSVAIPRLLSARLSANESSAIAALRSIATTQAQLQSSAGIDTDADGAGEFGYFGELAGARPVRISIAGAPAAGVPGVDVLAQPLLPPTFAAVDLASEVFKSGYLFKLWLPAATVGGVTAAIAEDPGGGKLAAPFPDSDNGELLWCVYAWPLQATSGNRAFFMNERGDVLQTRNRGLGAYVGGGGGPAFDAVFSVPGDMASPVGIQGVPANDGNLWTIVQ